MHARVQINLCKPPLSVSTKVIDVAVSASLGDTSEQQGEAVAKALEKPKPQP